MVERRSDSEIDGAHSSARQRSGPPDRGRGDAGVHGRYLLALAAAVAAGLVGWIVLAGWWLGIPALATLIPGVTSMKANTALMLGILGTSLALSIALPALRSPARIASVIVLLVAVAITAEYVVGSLGIDELLVADPAPILPGRPSIATAAALALAAAALITLNLRGIRPSVSHALGLLALLIGGTTTLGYLYGVTELYSFGDFSSIGLQTSMAMTILAVGIVFAQPETVALGRISGATAGGFLIRRLLPATALVPIGLGFLVLLGTRAGLYSPQFAVALLVVAIVILLRFVVYRTAVVLDVSESARLKASADVRRLAGREQIVSRTIADGVVTIDQSSRIELVNDAAERIFGYSAAELVGRPLTVLMPETLRGRHLAAIGRYLETGVRTINWDGIEIVGRRSNGEEFPIEVAFAEDRSGDHRTFTGAIRDISARKNLEAQLARSQRLESVGRLAGGVAHDFNNILTAILGFARLTLDEPPNADPERQKVRAIEDAAVRGARLVAQLLAFSRQQVLRPEVLDLADVLDGLKPMLERLIGEDITISTRIADDRWRTEADRGQLEQVIVNLGVNARDAMPQGGRLTIEVSNAVLDNEYVASHPEATAGQHLLLTMSDTGEGMDAATQSRIFEPFFTTKEAGRGSGLGLATVYGIVRQSGGHVSVYSEPGRGTAFRVYLPRAVRPAERPAVHGMPPIETSGTETILVAEDEEVLRKLIDTVLSRLGYRVLMASDANEALEIAGREQVDMLLTDVVMPGGSGIDLANRIRVARPTFPVLFMSGYSAAALEQQEGPPAEDLLQKPFSPTDLGRAVRAALDQAGAYRDAGVPADR